MWQLKHSYERSVLDLLHRHNIAPTRELGHALQINSSLRPMSAALAPTRTASPLLMYTAERAPLHIWEGNQEGPRRVDAILGNLRDAGITTGPLADQVTHALRLMLQERLILLDPDCTGSSGDHTEHCKFALLQLNEIQDFDTAERDTIQLVHTPDYVAWLAKEVREGAPKVIADPEIPEEVTYITSSSYVDAARVRACPV